MEDVIINPLPWEEVPNDIIESVLTFLQNANWTNPVRRDDGNIFHFRVPANKHGIKGIPNSSTIKGIVIFESIMEYCFSHLAELTKEQRIIIFEDPRIQIEVTRLREEAQVARSHTKFDKSQARINKIPQAIRDLHYSNVRLGVPPFESFEAISEAVRELGVEITLKS